jgi:hypothetical protein
MICRSINTFSVSGLFQSGRLSPVFPSPLEGEGATKWRERGTVAYALTYRRANSPSPAPFGAPSPLKGEGIVGTRTPHG